MPSPINTSEIAFDRPATGDERLALDIAQQTDLSPHQVRELIDIHGANREKLLAVARTIKAEG